MIDTVACIPPGTSTLLGKVTRGLHKSGHIALKNLQVSTDLRTVTLQGCVPTYYLKQVAQTVAKSVDGVAAVVNNTVVAPPDSWRPMK